MNAITFKFSFYSKTLGGFRKACFVRDLYGEAVNALRAKVPDAQDIKCISSEPLFAENPDYKRAF